MPQHKPMIFLELGELLNSLAGTGQHAEDVETDLKSHMSAFRSVDSLGVVEIRIR